VIFRGIFKNTTLQQNVVSLKFISPDVAIVETLLVSGMAETAKGTTADSKGRLRTRLLPVVKRQVRNRGFASARLTWRCSGLAVLAFARVARCARLTAERNRWLATGMEISYVEFKNTASLDCNPNFGSITHGVSDAGTLHNGAIERKSRGNTRQT